MTETIKLMGITWPDRIKSRAHADASHRHPVLVYDGTRSRGFRPSGFARLRKGGP